MFEFIIFIFKAWNHIGFISLQNKGGERAKFFNTFNHCDFFHISSSYFIMNVLLFFLITIITKVRIFIKYSPYQRIFLLNHHDYDTYL